ncbi:MAG: inorganic phosphate transporter, partial [Methylocystis sp.]
GSNDGQKGMGLIMLILIGTVPTAYALNRSLPASHIADFARTSAAAIKVVQSKEMGHQMIGDPRPAVSTYITYHGDAGFKPSEGTYVALAALMNDISKEIEDYGAISKIPFAAVGNTRNDIYLASEALRFLAKDEGSELTAGEQKILADYKTQIDAATKFIPTWVKVSVAVALGLGTMIGWKRIVVTVGEKIGKEHLTYGQGAAAELVAMTTIGIADTFGLPVSTTHVLSSGVAGTMAANGSGIQMSTIKSIATAWVLTLPCAMILAGSLYFFFSKVF